MTRLARTIAVALTMAVVGVALSGSAAAQERRRGDRQGSPPAGTAVRREPGRPADQRPAPRPADRPVARPHPVHVGPAPIVRGHVFIGGYFYDPYFGPYPWWNRTVYPYWYAPVFDLQASVRIKVTPKDAKEAAVYVDGFYAGVVDDFDGVFQSLALTPGGHVIVLYLEGYRTIRHNLYLARGSSFTLEESLLRLPPGEVSQPPEVAPPLPPPTAGSYRLPGGARTPSAPARAAITAAEGFGTLDLFVQPENAEVSIDGERWVSNEDGHYLLQLPAGTHRLEVVRRGYRTFATTVEVTEGATVPLNVGLTMATT